MSLHRRGLFVLAASLATGTAARPVHAQVMVYDPAAVAEAIKQVSQGLEQIEHLKSQLQQQAQMIAGLGIDVTGPLTQIAAEATGLLRKAQGLGYSAIDLSRTFAELYPDDLTGLTAKDLAGRLAAWSNASRRTLQEAMEVQNQIVQAQPVTAGAVSAAVAASQAAGGQTAAVQATNQLLAALSTQLGQLQTLLITQARQAETFEAERRALAAKAEADRRRNSLIVRPSRRFSAETL
jgi:P-type conjugative transfer protein TrbJ